MDNCIRTINEVPKRISPNHRLAPACLVYPCAIT